MKHAGKSAVVTGAANGIGLACARCLIEEGAKVVLADINREKAVAEARALDPTGTVAVGVGCDISRRADVVSAIQQATKRFGKLDIMVNNAGISSNADVLDVTDEDFDRIIGTNLKGTFYGTQEAARVMVAAGGGAIVNMSSIQASLTFPVQMPYGVSKAGISQMTRIFAVALANRGVRVNGVAPGTIFTDASSRAVLTSPEARHRVLSRTPMGRFGKTEEIGRVVSFLASSDASYLTGQVLYVDGGRMPLNYTVPVTAEDPLASR